MSILIVWNTIMWFLAINLIIYKWLFPCMRVYIEMHIYISPWEIILFFSITEVATILGKSGYFNQGTKYFNI